MPQATDPVTREIIKNARMGTADARALAVVRTARSAVIKHGMDFSTSRVQRRGTAGGPRPDPAAPPGFHGPALEGVVKAFGNDVGPGDIFANNDSYEGAIHLPDILVFPAKAGIQRRGSCCVFTRLFLTRLSCELRESSGLPRAKTHDWGCEKVLEIGAHKMRRKSWVPACAGTTV